MSGEPPAKYELIGSRGCGSVIVEMALELARLPYAATMIPYLQPGPERDRLISLNPLGQVPTLLLPDGQVMTESAAMILHIADRAPEAGLAPAANDRLRPKFLNLLVVLVGAIYPTFTYGDTPSDWTEPGAPSDLLRERLDRRRTDLWRHLEQGAPGPFMLGSRFSALDLYLCAMTRWRPRRDWFAAQTPKLLAAADATAAMPELAGIIDRNFASRD